MANTTTLQPGMAGMVLDEFTVEELADLEGTSVVNQANLTVNVPSKKKGSLQSIQQLKARSEQAQANIERQDQEAMIRNSQDEIIGQPGVSLDAESDEEVEEDDFLEENTVYEEPSEEDGELDEDEVISEETVSEEETEKVEEEKFEVAEDPKPEEKKEEAAPVDETVRDENAISIETSTTKITDDEKDEDLDAEVSTTDNTSSTDENKLMVSLQRQITERIRPVSKKRNLEGFTVATTPIALTDNVIKEKEVSIAKWPLPATGITIQMRELLGSDLEDLRTLMNQSDARGVLEKIYSAIVSPKPAFNIWVKQVAFEDYDHLFMAMYIAAFKGSNYIPVDCSNPNCPEKTYITEDIPFARLVKYKNNEAKEKFQKLYKESPADTFGLVPTEVIPISDQFAIGFVIPSLYSILMETDYFDRDFRRKYSTAIAVAPYIDKFYFIDYDNKKFVPVSYKVYENNEAKTAKSKIIKYNKILRTMNSDEINSIKACMEGINNKNNLISYIMPSTTCPHCGTENAESDTQASAMLFLRNQLAALVNTSIN